MEPTAASARWIPTGTITTFAGGGSFHGRRGAGTNAILNNPSAVAIDSTGNVYIAEYGGNRIRVVGLDGTIHTIAGNGLQGFSGDGSVATSASLNSPTDVKVDSQGNVYIVGFAELIHSKADPSRVAADAFNHPISNAASLLGGPVTPGERIIIKGTTLGPNSQVMFDTYPAPVLTSSLTSTLVVVPYEVGAADEFECYGDHQRGDLGSFRRTDRAVRTRHLHGDG